MSLSLCWTGFIPQTSSNCLSFSWISFNFLKYLIFASFENFNRWKMSMQSCMSSLNLAWGCSWLTSFKISCLSCSDLLDRTIILLKFLYFFQFSVLVMLLTRWEGSNFFIFQSPKMFIESGSKFILATERKYYLCKTIFFLMS